jgi:hypothetical protein
MNNTKIKTTNQKFYNKWLYKVSFKVKSAYALRSFSNDGLLDFCNSPDSEQDSYRPNSTIGRAFNHREELLRVGEFFKTYESKEWSKRIEGDTIDFYTNDRDLYDAAALEFNSTLVHQFEPESGSLDLMNDEKNIIVKKLPHNKYRYKVFLQPHKMQGDKAAKQQYIDWVKKQTPRITFTDAIAAWFLSTEWNWDRRYVLVEDDHTLLLLKLRNSEVVGRIYNYVIPVNT